LCCVIFYIPSRILVLHNLKWESESRETLEWNENGKGTLQNKGFKGEGNLALGLGIPNKDNYLIF
jgi:hypothetical protein